MWTVLEPHSYIPHTRTVKPQMCECSPAEMLIPVLACRSETKLSSENFELCCKFHLDFWESTNTGHDLWHCGLCRLVLNEWAVSLVAVHCWKAAVKVSFQRSIIQKHIYQSPPRFFVSQMQKNTEVKVRLEGTWDGIWPDIKVWDY